MSHKRGILVGLLASSPILVAFSEPYQATGPLGLDWWIWILILALALVILAVLIGWWWLGRRPEEEAALPKPAAPPPEPPTVVAEPPSPAVPDELKRIEGIGPKIAELLQEAGIMTFAQLAATDVGRLKQILEEANLQHLADPSTWPEQAMLASAGDWDAFEALQEELKGGRRA